MVACDNANKKWLLLPSTAFHLHSHHTLDLTVRVEPLRSQRTASMQFKPAKHNNIIRQSELLPAGRQAHLIHTPSTHSPGPTILHPSVAATHMHLIETMNDFFGNMCAPLPYHPLLMLHVKNIRTRTWNACDECMYHSLIRLYRSRPT